MRKLLCIALMLCLLCVSGCSSLSDSVSYSDKTITVFEPVDVPIQDMVMYLGSYDKEATADITIGYMVFEDDELVVYQYKL